MKKFFLKIIANLILFISVSYANQASGVFLYNEKLPFKVKLLRKF